MGDEAIDWSTVQVTFDRLKAGSLPPKFSTVRAEAGPRDLLTITCQVEASGVAFVIFATQQTPSSVKLSTCDVTIEQLTGKVQVKVQNIHEELLQVNASFEGRPNLQLSVKPQNSSKNDPVDLLVVEEIVRSALMGATTIVDLSPSMVPPPIREVITASQAGYQMAQRPPSYQTGTNANLRKSSGGQLNTSRPTPADRRLLVKVIKANGLRERDGMTASDPFCVVIMDQPSQKHKTNIIRNTVNPFWDEHFLFELGSISRELRFEVYDRDRMLRETLSDAVKDMTESIKAGRAVSSDEFIGEAIVSLEALERNPSSRQIIPLQGRELEVDNIKGSLTVEPQETEIDNIMGSLTVEFLFMEPADQVYMDSPGNTGVTYKSRVPASPTKRVETQRTVTPDGTVITTVTTTTARPKQMDRKAAMNNVPTRVVTSSSTLPEPQHAATTLIMDPNDETTTTTDQNISPTGYGPSAGYGPNGGYSPDTPNSGLGGSINYSDGTPSPGPSFGYNGDVHQAETVTVDSQGNPTPSVAETAIKHLSEQSQEKPQQQRTPTKKSTLIIHGVSQTPTQDLSLESPDEPVPRETNFKRDASPRGSKRRFNPFKKKDKEGKEGKETKEEKKKSKGKEKRRISDASTESGERKSRKDKESKANTLDVPPSGKRSSSLSRESSPSRAKRKVMNFLRRDKGRGRSQSETSDELLNGNAESPTSTSASVNVNLSVPGQGRSASTGDLQLAQGTMDESPRLSGGRHQAQTDARKSPASTVTQRPLAKPDTKR
ncbi:uncharacterized protein [Amphiura filiformis]|uniref:uncharacterized protein n=1 Tax=Amphiura filiformis TaxID=82378 RepID=UPI003B2135A9